MAKKSKVVDALSPLDAITSAFAIVVIALMSLGVVAVVFGGSSMGIGEESVCVDANFSSGDEPTADDRALAREAFDLEKGVTVQQPDTVICQADPSLAQSTLDTLSIAPSFVVFLGFLLLTRRIIRHARRTSLFSAALAQMIERAGWLLLLGLLAAAGVEFLADGLLKASMSSMSWVNGSFSVSVAGIIGAYGIITVGRVMLHAASLQADSDATI